MARDFYPADKHCAAHHKAPNVPDKGNAKILLPLVHTYFYLELNKTGQSHDGVLEALRQRM